MLIPGVSIPAWTTPSSCTSLIPHTAAPRQYSQWAIVALLHAVLGSPPAHGHALRAYEQQKTRTTNYEDSTNPDYLFHGPGCFGTAELPIPLRRHAGHSPTARRAANCPPFRLPRLGRRFQKLRRQARRTNCPIHLLRDKHFP